MDVVTGALGYSGRFIAAELLRRGRQVRTLTNSPGRPHGFGQQLEVRPLRFELGELVESLRGAETLYNTYWVRFNRPPAFTFKQAVANTKVLFAAAREAGVKNIVHVSITKPTLDSPLEYFRGKAELERELAGLGVAYSILRPAVLFGGADILVNNMAWVIRRFPVVGVFGDGQYGIQPMHVEDFAALAVRCGGEPTMGAVSAVGPERWSYRGLLEQLMEILGVRRPIVRVPTAVGYAVSKVTGWMVGDVVLTWQEIRGLMGGLLAVEEEPPPEARTKLTNWAQEHRDVLGRRYASELGRRRNREGRYEEM